MSLCFKCRAKNGYEPKDNGAHTAMVKPCEECGEIRPILPARHYVKKNNQSDEQGVDHG